MRLRREPEPSGLKRRPIRRHQRVRSETGRHPCTDSPAPLVVCLLAAAPAVAQEPVRYVLDMRLIVHEDHKAPLAVNADGPASPTCSSMREHYDDDNGRVGAHERHHQPGPIVPTTALDMARGPDARRRRPGPSTSSAASCRTRSARARTSPRRRTWLRPPPSAMGPARPSSRWSSTAGTSGPTTSARRGPVPRRAGLTGRYRRLLGEPRRPPADPAGRSSTPRPPTVRHAAVEWLSRGALTVEGAGPHPFDHRPTTPRPRSTTGRAPSGPRGGRGGPR